MALELRPRTAVVKPDEREVSAALSDLYLPDSYKPACTGRVVKTRTYVDVGVHVLYAPNAGLKIKTPTEQYLLLHEGDILAVLEEE